MNDVRSTQIAISEWLKPLVASAGSINKLAIKSGVSKQTIGRAIDPKPEYTSVMTTVNILKIAAAMGVAPPAGIGAPGLPSGFSEPESYPLSHNEISQDIRPEHPDQMVFRLNTRAIDLPPFGYLPGDEIVIDRSLPARKNDVVCVQLSDKNSGEPETIWRVYDPPYLYPHTTDITVPHKPLTVDGDLVQIIGPIIKLFRVCRDAA